MSDVRSATVLDELFDWAERHNIPTTMTAERIPGEPVRGADGRLYSGDTAGDMRVSIDCQFRHDS